MGVPAFFRWLAAKYPLILEDLIEDGVIRASAMATSPNEPEPHPVTVDNLYLDTNGIVHPCCHPEDGPQPKNEDDMFSNIAALIDRLVACARPQRMLFIALDGTAPRAKMNQQRVRRFCSAREAQEVEEARRELATRRAQLGQAAEDEEHERFAIIH